MSIVAGYFAGKNAAPVSEVESVPVPFAQSETMWVAAEFLLWSLVVLTAAALIWMIAPVVVSVVRFGSASVADAMSFSLPIDCAAASGMWYVTKRVLVGYAGLAVGVVAITCVWCFMIRLRRIGEARRDRRWTVVVDDCESS